MTEIKLFVDANYEIKNKVLICQSNATKLGVKNGDSVEVLNIDNNLKTNATIVISDTILDFAGQFAKNLLDDVQFSGVELTVRPVSAAAKLTPTLKVPKVPKAKLIPPPEPTSAPQLPPAPKPPPEPTPTSQPSLSPLPTPPPEPTSIPQPVPSPTPAPQPSLSPLPTKPPPPMEVPQPSHSQPMIEPVASIEQFPNKININTLKGQRNGIILTPILDNNIEGGRVKISVDILPPSILLSNIEGGRISTLIFTLPPSILDNNIEG